MADEELIDGLYKLVMCIATGGSSQVWECVEHASGRHLAMKLLKQDSPDFKENKAGLKHEADVLKSLDHPLIVKFEKFSASRDNTYMVMEHFRASNVKLQLKSDMRSLHVRARKLFESVCQALSHVHSRGWIHRDVKPDNVLMNKAGEIRLVDFSLASKEVKGFAKMVGGGKLKTIQGTRTYIAPETIRKQAPVFQTDLYSLGIMFFEVLTGRTPFQAPTPEELLMRHLRDEPANASEFNPNVTPEMDRLIQRLLKKKPADRPGGIDEVLGELRRIRVFKEDVTEARAEDDESSPAMDQLTDIRLDSRADAKLSQMLQSNPELARQFVQEKQAKSAKKKADAALVAERARATNDREAAKAAKKGGAAPPPMAPPMIPPQMMPPQMMPQAMMPPMMPQMMPPQPMMPQMMPQAMPPYPPQPGYPQFPPQPPFGAPPGAMPPGAMPPGAMPPAMMPPGVMPPAPMPQPIPGAMPPGMPPGMPAAPVGMPPVTPPTGQAVPPAPAAVAPVVAPPPVVKPPAPPTAVPPTAAPPAVNAAPAKPAPAKPVPAPAPKPAKPAPPPVNPDDLEFMTELPDVL